MTITTVKKGKDIFRNFDKTPVYYLEIDDRIEGKIHLSYKYLKELIEREHVKKDVKRLELFKQAIEKIELIDKGQEADIMNDTKNNN